MRATRVNKKLIQAHKEFCGARLLHRYAQDQMVKFCPSMLDLVTPISSFLLKLIGIYIKIKLDMNDTAIHAQS